jgi:hypothetical protein
MTSSRQCVFVEHLGSFAVTGYSSQLSQAALRATSVLAIVALLFGVACATLISASLEQRLGSFLFFGLGPAICFYASGHILCGALVAAGKLFTLLATCCIRCAAGLLSVLFNSFIPFLSNRFDRFPVRALSQGLVLSPRQLFLCLRVAIYAFACWAIRSVARFLISIEAVWQRG